MRAILFACCAAAVATATATTATETSAGETAGQSAVDVWTGPAVNADIECSLLPVPGAVAIFSRYRSARVCAPKGSGRKLPLHLFAHANLGGSIMALAYNRILEQIAARGFVVAAYLGCAIDPFCDNGESSFVEIFKTIAALKNGSAWDDSIDWTAPYSMSGHSTGARSVLQGARSATRRTT